MKFGLKKETIEKINKVLAKYPQIEEAIIYGSRAKGNYKNGSDIDLTLKGRNLDYSIAGKVNSDLDDSLLPYTFDISVFDQIDNPDLVDRIKRRGIVFYQSKS